MNINIAVYYIKYFGVDVENKLIVFHLKVAWRCKWIEYIARCSANNIVDFFY